MNKNTKQRGSSCCLQCRRWRPDNSFPRAPDGAQQSVCKQCGNRRGFRKKTAQIRKSLENDSDLVLELRWAPKPSEFEIQSWLYRNLRELGYLTRGEVRPKCHGAIRLDLVIFAANRRTVLLVIELKKQDRPSADIRRAARKQVKRYKRCGAPVCLVWGLTGARALLEYIKSNGIPLSDRID